MIELVEYDRECLDRSWHWLSDPEIRSLTMSAPFTREQQLQFFESLPSRAGYRIWGVACGGTLIGAAGLKNFRDTIAEYWTYIGDRSYWGQGHGRSIFFAVEEQARQLGLTSLDMKVTKENARSIALHERIGFVLDEDSSSEQILRMVKHPIK